MKPTNSIIDTFRKMDEKQRNLLVYKIISVLVVVIGAIFLIFFFLNYGKEDSRETMKPDSETMISTEEIISEETSSTEIPETEKGQTDGTETEGTVSDAEDPQEALNGNMTQQSGTSVNVQDVISQNPNETSEITFGIDVAKYQGTIDWKQVADSGVDFVMIRVGYRTLQSGELTADTNARFNMQEAQKYGIKAGAYFFSTAVSVEEAKAEANWVADYVSQYKITYPVAYNCEGFEDPQSRQYSLSKTERTDIAIAFLETIEERGYTPMFYAAKSELEADTKWETSRIAPSYKIWVAQYPSQPYPKTPASSYTGAHDMWQYTNVGTIPGISKPVDVNIAYFGYETVEDAKNETAPEEVGADVEALMNFREVNETVTAKDKTNLRDKPSQGADSSILYTLSNGETASRTGISDSGWSRIVLNGTTYYAVSNYLTTDLSYKPPVPEPDDGIQTPFTSINEQVTAKEVVNLRTLPSVTREDSQVAAQLKNGEVITRTGINHEYGWSRVDYNGQTLYCVSSYLHLAQ